MEEEKKSAPFGTQSENEIVSQQSAQVDPLASISEIPNEQERSISIEEAFVFGWKTFKANMKLLLLLALAYFAISIAVSMLSKIAEGETLFVFAVTLASVILNIIVTIGLVQIILKISRGGQANVGEIFGDMKYFWKFLGSSILYGLIVVAGYLLFIIPGIVWQIKYGFFQYFIIDKDMSPVEAIKESGRITNGLKWKLFLLQFAIMFMFLVGLLFFGIGILVAYPISLLMMVFVYRKLIGEKIEIVS